MNLLGIHCCDDLYRAQTFVCRPDVHEPDAADVGGVPVLEHGRELLPRQLEGEELEEQAVGRGDNATSSHPPHL